MCNLGALENCEKACSQQSMIKLTTEQRVSIVECYVRSRGYVIVQIEFRERFPHREPPAKRTIQENVSKYHNLGTSLNVIREIRGG